MGTNGIVTEVMIDNQLIWYIQCLQSYTLGYAGYLLMHCGILKVDWKCSPNNTQNYFNSPGASLGVLHKSRIIHKKKHNNMHFTTTLHSLTEGTEAKGYETKRTLSYHTNFHGCNFQISNVNNLPLASVYKFHAFLLADWGQLSLAL